MRISEQIKVLCVRNNISVSELARRMGTSPQNFNAKLKRETFTVEDLEQIAEATGLSVNTVRNQISRALQSLRNSADSILDFILLFPTLPLA